MIMVIFLFKPLLLEAAAFNYSSEHVQFLCAKLTLDPEPDTESETMM